MLNTFKHTGFITLADGQRLLYAFGPNQSAILCQLQGWEFWEMEEQLLPALYLTSRYATLQADKEADPAELKQALEQANRCLFSNPLFVQAFYYAACRAGAEIQGEEFEYTPAQVGMLYTQEPIAFLPAFSHYAQIQTDRYSVAAARPTSTPRAGGSKTKSKKS